MKQISAKKEKSSNNIKGMDRVACPVVDIKVGTSIYSDIDLNVNLIQVILLKGTIAYD